MRLAASVERASQHPLATAILRAAEERKLALAEVADFAAPVGKGVSGRVEDHQLVLGNARLLLEAGIDVAALSADAETMRQDGATVVFVAIDGKAAGLLAIADPIKSTTPRALEALKAEGLRVVMLTGDTATTARAVAARLGITEVEAEVLPEDKSEVVERLRREGHVVAMAGDGSTMPRRLPPPTLAWRWARAPTWPSKAPTSRCFQGDLGGIVRARRLSAATMANIRQNLFFAFI